MRSKLILFFLSPPTRCCCLLQTTRIRARAARRCLHPFLQFSLTPLRQCKAPSFGPLLVSNTNTIAFFSSKSNGGAPHRLHFAYPYSRCSGGSRASRMSANGSDSSSASSVVARKPSISFCQSCGSPTKQVVPDGEERTRAVCSICGKIHYKNPKMVSGAQWQGAATQMKDSTILWVLVQILASMTLPAGFMEIGESALEGATRETLEEACAEVGLSSFAQIDIPHIGQVYLIFRAKLKKLHYSPGPESLECRFFSPEDVPFDSLAFSSIIVSLRLYVEDIKAGNFKFHYCTLNRRPGASMTEPNGFDVDYLLPSGNNAIAWAIIITEYKQLKQ